MAVFRPILDVDANRNAEPHGVDVVVNGLGKSQLTLQQSGATRSIDDPASREVALARTVAYQHPVWRAVVVDIDPLDGGAHIDRDARVARAFAEEILEDATVDLVACHAEVAADTDFLDLVDAIAAI